MEKCEARVERKPESGEDCEEELFDIVHCVDHCAGEKIFKVLK